MPAGTVKVDRTSKRWGNPFKIGVGVVHDRSDDLRQWWLAVYHETPPVPRDASEAVALYRKLVLPPRGDLGFAAVAQRELRGRSLACWCKPGAPCHADVLLEVANPIQCDEAA